MSEAKVRISLNDGTIEFEGSEAFVTAQLDKFSEVVQVGLLKSKETTTGNDSASAGKPPADSVVPKGLEHVFAKNGDGVVQILVDIPGASGAEKTTNAAKLYLYGQKQLGGKDIAYFEEIKEVCKKHGFYDGTNMASNLKADKASFIFGGSGKKQTLALTVPGTAAAKKLVEQAIAGTEE